MDKNFKNIETKRYKECGYGDEHRDEDGHLEDIVCGWFNNDCKFCGDIVCPFDMSDVNEDLYDDDYHGEDKGYK